jgi:anti-sigma B factor antagonist
VNPDPEPTAALSVDIKFWDEKIAVVTCIGELDVYGAQKLRDAFTALNNQGLNRVLVDLSQVSYIDSTGMGTMIGALKRTRSVGGSLDLACNQEGLLRFFRGSGLTIVFRIFGSQAAARRYL